MVPSVVHWKQNHYAAIVGKDGPMYKVMDPTFGQPRWMSGDVINAEASGAFMVLSSQIPNGWVRISNQQASQIFGKGRGGGLDGSSDRLPCECPPGPCPLNHGGPTRGPGPTPNKPGNPGNSPNGDNAHATGSGGSTFDSWQNSIIQLPIPPTPGAKGSDCSSCGDRGTPGWFVKEPFIDLWLHDVPLAYQPSLGREMRFELFYKQRATTPDNPRTFGPGKMWGTRWLNYIHYHTPGEVPFYEGGLAAVPLSSDGTTANYDDGSKLSYVTDHYERYLPDGAVEVYGFYASDIYGHNGDYFMTSKTDAAGHTTTFNYATYDSVNNPSVRLTSITDADSNTITISYVSGNAYGTNLIYQVTDPYSRVTTLNYDSSGHLTGIQDTAGMSSTVNYDGNGWPTSLVTPYGTNTFQLAGSSDAIPEDNSISRSARILRPDGGVELYAFRDGCADFLDSSYSDADNVPSSSPLGTLDNTYMYYRNSFYWGPRQYANLSTTNMDSFTPADFSKGRLRHWLHDHGTVGTLSMERAPSPDSSGSTTGKMTWYDYAGKTSGNEFYAGTTAFVGAIIQVVPDYYNSGRSTHYIRIDRNSFGWPTSVIETYNNPSGGSVILRTNIYTYAANDIDLLAVTGPTGETLATYGYNSNHQMTAYTNSVGDFTHWIYDGNGRLKTNILATGLTRIYSYGGDGYVSGISDSETGRSESFTWSNGLPYTHTDDRGTARTFTWDNLLRMTQIDYADSTLEKWIYDKLDISAYTNRLGNYTHYGYDRMGKLTAVTNGLGKVTTYSYCSCGSLDSITDGLGKMTSFTYNNAGWKLTVTDADTNTVYYGYDALGRVGARSDVQSTNYFCFDNPGNLVRGDAWYGGVSFLKVFDIEDNPISVTDASGLTVTQTFDTEDRLRTRTYPDPDTGVEAFGYVAAGLRFYTNQLGKVTKYGYDTGARRVTETNANSQIISYTYNAAGDLRTLTDSAGHVTKWGYDGYGRVTTKTNDSNTKILAYTYDCEGNLTNRWSVAKGNTGYAYDAVRHLTAIDYPNISGNQNATYAYDAIGHLTNMVDQIGTTAFSYTPAGRLLTEDGPWSSDTITYDYDFTSSGRRKTMTITQPTGSFIVTNTYDIADRLATVGSPAGVSTYSYINQGLLKRGITLPNASYITNFYDTGGRLTETDLKNSSHTVLDKIAYLVNAGNQRTRQTRTDSSYYSFTYDNIGQMHYASSTVSSEYRQYEFDAAGNIAIRYNDATEYDYSVDNLNQITVEPGYPATEYDGNGNLTGRKYDDCAYSWTYTYDDDNQLTSVESYDDVVPSYFTALVYDGLGRLRQRVESHFNLDCYAWDTIDQVNYIYDGRRVVQERNSGNTPTVTYTRGSDLSGTLEGAGGIGGLLARSHGYSGGTWSTHHYYHADGGGNITSMVDGSQSLSASYRYDPFGNEISSSGSMASANVYHFSSKEFHATSGLYYYGYRWYDPFAQRWLNQDPIQENGGINLYGFVGNEPVNYYDPVGESLVSNGSFLVQWLVGALPGYIEYGPGDIELDEMRKSRGAKKLRDRFAKTRCNDVKNFGYGSGEAFFDTLFNPFTADPTSTAAQVGGFAGASAINNGDGTVTFSIDNYAGTHSFFYHLLPDWDLRIGDFLNMRTVHQRFVWTEPIPRP